MKNGGGEYMKLIDTLLCYLRYLEGRERDCDNCKDVELCNRGVELIRKCECHNIRGLRNLLRMVHKNEKNGG